MKAARVLSAVDAGPWNNDYVLSAIDSGTTDELQALNEKNVDLGLGVHKDAMQRIIDFRRRAWCNHNNCPYPMSEKNQKMWLAYVDKRDGVAAAKVLIGIPEAVFGNLIRYQKYFQRLEVWWTDRGGIDAILVGTNVTVNGSGDEHTVLARWSTMSDPPLSQEAIENTILARKKSAPVILSAILGIQVAIFVILQYWFYALYSQRPELISQSSGLWEIEMIALGALAGITVALLQRRYIFDKYRVMFTLR